MLNLSSECEFCLLELHMHVWVLFGSAMCSGNGWTKFGQAEVGSKVNCAIVARACLALCERLGGSDESGVVTSSASTPGTGYTCARAFLYQHRQR